MNKIIGLIAAIPLLLLAAEINGKVVGITDGDTFTLLSSEREQHKIRLRHIDAPEKKQPFGLRSKQALSDLLYWQPINASCHGKSLERHICDVTTVDGVDVQAEMIKQGMAWVFPKYNRRDDLPPLQAVAKAAKLGIWSLPEIEQTPPWEWRQQRKK